MTVDELVDRLIQYFDNISTTDGGYGSRTARTLIYLQQVYEDVENFREWSWRQTFDSSTVTANLTSFALPVDYGSLGRSGGLSMRAGASDAWSRVTQGTPELIAEYIDRQVSPEALAQDFAIYSKSINFPYMGATVFYKLRYLKTPKQLAYGATPDDEFDTHVSYHASVLQAGTIARMARSKGDAREDWMKQYRLGLADMVARERDPESEAQQMPEVVPPMC